MISLTIDEKKIEAPEGATVLEAARLAKIDIPTLCHDPRMKPHGACRLCIVDIAGLPRPVTSCTTPATEGMVVTTTSPRLERLRKTTVELLLSDHPNDCMVCIQAGDCTLQELAYRYAIRENRFQGAVRQHNRVDNNPFIMREQDKCVLCGLCVRVCDEVQGVGAIGYANRGFESDICPPFKKDLDCEFCGQCVSVCPTGALSAKMWAGQPRLEGSGDYRDDLHLLRLRLQYHPAHPWQQGCPGHFPLRQPQSRLAVRQRPVRLRVHQQPGPTDHSADQAGKGRQARTGQLGRGPRISLQQR